MRDLRRPALVGACLALAGAWWWTSRQDSALRALAEEAACDGKVCDASLVKTRRTLFGRSYEFDVVAEHNSRNTVECERVFWVFGKHECALTREDPKSARGHVVSQP